MFLNNVEKALFIDPNVLDSNVHFGWDLIVQDLNVREMKDLALFKHHLNTDHYLDLHCTTC